MAYIFSLARPRQGIEIESLVPPLAFACPLPLASSATSVTNSQPCRWSHAGPTDYIATTRLAFPHLSLSLPPSTGGSGITTTHTAPRPASCTFSPRGRRFVFILILLFRTRARSLSPLQQFEVITRSQLMLASWSSGLMAHLALPKQKKTEIIKETINVAGLLTNVYSRSDLRNNFKGPSEPVVVLLFLHKRLDSSDTVDPIARAAFAWAAKRQASSKRNPRDFVVVTFVRAVFHFRVFPPFFFRGVRTSSTWSGFGRKMM